MICKIKRYGIGKINAYSTVDLPKESVIIGVIAKDTEPGEDVIQLLVEEPIHPKDYEVEMDVRKVLITHDDAPYGEDLGEGEYLAYVGTVLWDNTYKIHHVFQVIDESYFNCDIDSDIQVQEFKVDNLRYDNLRADLEDLKKLFWTKDQNEDQPEESIEKPKLEEGGE